MVLKTNRVADLVSKLYVHLFAHSFGHTHSSHSPGLCASDFATLSKTCVIEVLSDLCSFTASCFSDNDQDIVVDASLHQLLLIGKYGETLLLFFYRHLVPPDILFILNFIWSNLVENFA